jgi:predicted molibdopterin-dependent oxidoreductase YjgC
MTRATGDDTDTQMRMMEKGRNWEGRHFIAGWADAGKTLSEMVRVIITWCGVGGSFRAWTDKDGYP